MENNLYYIDETKLKGTKADIIDYVKKEMTNQLQNETDTENLADNLKLTGEILELIEENQDTDIIKLQYNPMGAWFKAEAIEQDFIFEVERLYNEHLERTENRNPSYGELAHIESLDLNELQELYNELLEEENGAGENEK